jgi:hypothetical protein
MKMLTFSLLPGTSLWLGLNLGERISIYSGGYPAEKGFTPALGLAFLSFLSPALLMSIR